MESKIAPLVFEYEAINGEKLARNPSVDQILRRINIRRSVPVHLVMNINSSSSSPTKDNYPIGFCKKWH